jgi:mannose/cellobiose epimerase-like protein (N-acyl-D-glucosamine 2-epimerase family)
MTEATRPDFRSPTFLRSHILRTMAFYEGRCLDPAGGFFHFFKDDGTVYDRTTRHLVSSTRFVITHAMAARRFAQNEHAQSWLDAARHGLRFLRDVHRDPRTGGYTWLLRFDGGRQEAIDPTNHAYGLAFVILAHAEAVRAGIGEARAGLDETIALMERHFWEADTGLYADEASVDWKLLPYRGQNANMHACEAMLACWYATHERRHYDRAAAIAEAITGRLAALTRDLVWEHWRRDDHGGWKPDWHYNRGDRTNIFRPWGYQTGHITEWAKLLLALDRAVPSSITAASNRAARAQTLFDAAMRHGWDASHGGLVYGFANTGDDPLHDPLAVCDGDKYFWVQAESIAAAAALAIQTGNASSWEWYDRLWTYAWRHFVDHEYGAWYRILAPDNRKLSDEKSPAGKVDYHTMGMCHEVLDLLAGAPQ